MAKPALFVENLFSLTQFADNLVTADEEGAGQEAVLVGRASRLAGSGWIPPTTNVEHSLKVQCRAVDPDGTTITVPRFADMLVLDRNTNLLGRRVILEGSFDDFATAGTEIFDLTIPKVPGGSIDGALGCVTREGAWLKAFSGDAFPYWRLRVPAMGVDLTPQVGHLMLGRLWRLKEFVDRPFEDWTFQVRWAERDLESMWIGAGRPRQRKELRMALRLEDDAEYEQAEYHVVGQFGRRRPMWAIMDLDEPERAALAIMRPGAVGFRSQTDGWFFRSGEVVGVEHEPLASGY